MFSSSSDQLRRHLHSLYKAIDKSSNLLWSHENHITGARTSRSDKKQLAWLNKDTTQIGYGEISMYSMTNLMNLFQNASILIKDYIDKGKLLNNSLKYQNVEDYNMNQNSFFLDIGSGFGKPVFHAAFQVGCKSVGYEVVPARVEFCLDFYYEFLDGKDFFKVNSKKSNNDDSTVEESDFNNKVNNKKKCLDFSKIYIDYDFYVNFIFSKNKNELRQSIFNSSDLAAPYINNQLLENYIYNKEIDDTPRSILAPDDHNIKINKRLVYYTQITIVSNNKVTNTLSDIISNNLTLGICENNSYLPFPQCNFYPDNLHLLNVIDYVNSNLVSFTFENSKFIINSLNLVCDIHSKERTIAKDTNENVLQAILNKSTFTQFNPLFYTNISFLSKDATKDKAYLYQDTENDFTHIYSYNKLMSDVCRKKISAILNKTNWKILAWYSNENQTKKSGLKKYFLIGKFPMSSTSTEKFYCYVYIKLK